MIPAEFIRDAIKGYRALAKREDKYKDFYRERADTLLDLLKSWCVYTVANDPDVIEIVQKVFNEIVDAISYKGDSLIEVFEKNESKKDGRD